MTAGSNDTLIWVLHDHVAKVFVITMDHVCGPTTFVCVCVRHTSKIVSDNYNYYSEQNT